jgi:hypothetical protein
LSDTELAAYIAEVRAAHPNATWQGELEFAYWCVGLSIGRDKWRRAWKAT